MPIVNWEETCSKCIFGSDEKKIASSKGKCTHKNPIQHFDWEQHAWERRVVRRERADEQNAHDYEVIELTRKPVADETIPAPGTPGDLPA